MLDKLLRASNVLSDDRGAREGGAKWYGSAPFRWATKLFMMWSFVTLFPVSNAYTQQFDAAYLASVKKHEAQWAKDEKQVTHKLKALEKRFGKKPNIIYILADDVGWGELGWQGGGKNRGTPSPVLDRVAFEGMRFWSAYAEPSCTPARVALNTGRLPVRTGLIAPLMPGEHTGLASEEITVAELLSTAGYTTAMWGKWHMGREESHAPENQGYDYSYYGLYNGAPLLWSDSAAMYEGATPAGVARFYDYPGDEAFRRQTGEDVSKGFFQGGKGKSRRAVHTTSQQGVLAFEKESVKQIVNYVKGNANSDKPFFVYWASYAQQLVGAPEYQGREYTDRMNNQASFMAMHNEQVGQIIETLKEEGIEENTLLVWISDNGPMYNFWPNSGYSWLRGGKFDVTEGGVRVPAMARWPGMIESNQDPVDLLHISDLFTTAVRIGGASAQLPGDRVIDGLDQTSLLLLGEGHGKREYMYHYAGPRLGAIRMGDLKLHLPENPGNTKEAELYNIRRDPGEKYSDMLPYLYIMPEFKKMVMAHKGLMMKFPNRNMNPMRGNKANAHRQPGQ